MMDCLEGMREIPDSSIDLLLTDPPYRIHAKSGGGLHNKREWLKNVHNANIDEFDPIDFLVAVRPKLKAFHAYIFCSKDLLLDYLYWVKNNDMNYEILIMGKNNPIPTKNNKYLSDKEYCLFVREPGKCYFDNTQPFQDYKTIQMVNVTKNEYHPAQKDVDYCKRLLRISTHPNDLVLDPFLGSGTTAVACKQLDRRYIGFENNQEYFDKAKMRLSQDVLI
jgi:site-specific DNA-methyltransferase (adenine-specific)